MTEAPFAKNDGPGWVVTAQVTDQVENNQANQTITGVRVYFTTSQGNDGVVFIPNNHYSPKNVHARVAAQARLIDEVGRLTADTHIR